MCLKFLKKAKTVKFSIAAHSKFFKVYQKCFRFYQALSGPFATWTEFITGKLKSGKRGLKFNKHSHDQNF